MPYPFPHTPFPYTPSPTTAASFIPDPITSTGSASTSAQSGHHIQMDPFSRPGYGEYQQPTVGMQDGIPEPDSDGDEEEGNRTREEREGEGSRSQSTESKEGGERTGSSKKKPRITLARGGACVACRNRKLKCTGERPCRTCQKANIECRYEEIQRKKPRAVLLEERVAELEGILVKHGEPLPPSQLSGIPSTSHHDDSKSRSSGKASPPMVSNGAPPPLSLHSHRDLQPPPNFTQLNTASKADIAPNSHLEMALITFVLPYTPFLLMPIHPQRCLALLSLSPSDPQRPHPSLLYILFAEAVNILERSIPAPKVKRPPRSLFPHAQSLIPPMPAAPSDTSYLLQHVSGMGLTLLERARSELDSGIRNVDRPFDLVRAAIGIARHLYALGRFIEGWNVPVSRLLVSCGLHRMSGEFVSPDGNTGGPVEAMPKPYAPSFQYVHTQTSETSMFPVLRMRPVIIPPARDEIELAERVLTFWSAKAQDWESGTGWGWSLSMADEECTTEWPWGWGTSEIKPMSTVNQRYGIRDMYDPSSPMHTSPFPDTTFVLGIKSLGLLHSASHLFDRPEASLPSPHPSLYIPSLSTVQKVETALHLFRSRIPTPFHDNPNPRTSEENYDGPGDPWWIMTHTNLYTAEMMMYKELANHQPQAYESAVGCARALVGLVRRLRPDNWVHVDMIVALNLSLASRFLYKESDRLAKTGQSAAAGMASEEAEILRVALATDYAKWLPMASLQSHIVQRVREGWPEKEGEYERV